MQADGKLVARGAFATFDGQPRSNLARLSAPHTVTDSLSIIGYQKGGSVVRWMRSGSAPELALPPKLEVSVNEGSSYGTIGSMQRISGGWLYSGWLRPLNFQFHLRTTAATSSSLYSSSSSLIQSTRISYLSRNDGIFYDGFE